MTETSIEQKVNNLMTGARFMVETDYDQCVSSLEAAKQQSTIPFLPHSALVGILVRIGTYAEMLANSFNEGAQLWELELMKYEMELPKLTVVEPEFEKNPYNSTTSSKEFWAFVSDKNNVVQAYIDNIVVQISVMVNQVLLTRNIDDRTLLADNLFVQAKEALVCIFEIEEKLSSSPLEVDNQPQG